MAGMKPFVQTLPLLLSPLAMLLVCALCAATGAAASNQTLLLHPDCAVIRIMDPAQVPARCHIPQNALHFDVINSTKGSDPLIQKVSLSLEAEVKTLRFFNLEEIAKPLPMPKHSDPFDDSKIIAILHPMPGWDAQALSPKCCEGLNLSPPRHTAQPRLSIQKIFVLSILLGLMCYCLILTNLNARRLPRGQRHRRRTRVSTHLWRTPFPLRLMPRQRVNMQMAP